RELAHREPDPEEDFVNALDGLTIDGLAVERERGDALGLGPEGERAEQAARRRRARRPLGAGIEPDRRAHRALAVALHAALELAAEGDDRADGEIALGRVDRADEDVGRPERARAELGEVRARPLGPRPLPR